MVASEKHLIGGNVASAVRVGDTVRRPTGPWTPAVHQLLRHLENAGFPAPRVLGTDEHDREVLTFIEGTTLGDPPWPAWLWEDRLVEQVGQLVRTYHEAVSDFRADAVHWRFTDRAPRAGEVICHNDIGFHNIVFRDRHPVALLDWDWAHPAPPAWDLAHAAWSCVPLMSPADGRRDGVDVCIARQAERLELLSVAYGLDQRADLVPLTADRIQFSIDQIGAADSDPGVAGLARFVPAMRRDLAFIDRNRSQLTP